MANNDDDVLAQLIAATDEKDSLKTECLQLREELGSLKELLVKVSEEKDDDPRLVERLREQGEHIATLNVKIRELEKAGPPAPAGTGATVATPAQLHTLADEWSKDIAALKTTRGELADAKAKLKEREVVVERIQDMANAAAREHAEKRLDELLEAKSREHKKIVERATSRLQELEHMVQNMVKERDTLTERCRKLTNERDELQGHLQISKQEIAKRDQSLARCAEQPTLPADLSSRIQQIITERGNYEQECHSLKGNNLILQQELSRMREMLTQRTDQVATLERDLASAQGQLKEMKPIIDMLTGLKGTK